ncbi:MAG: hypothetical protein VKS61_01970 [Candidatus Sericytochromatia bacterium]|nr:hypothetical protein [Candidatus Sericytochromatia bacterium]
MLLWRALSMAGAGALVLGLAGCSVAGLTGANAGQPYAVPDAGRRLVPLTFPQPPGATKATFRVRNAPANAKEGFGYADPPPDQTPDGHAAGGVCAPVAPGTFCVELDPARLPQNIYLVDVYLDDDLVNSRGTVAFVASAAAQADAAASPARAGYRMSGAEGTP